MYSQYGDAAQFLIVYIKEAHASDSRRPSKVNNRWEFVESPKNIFERYQVANTCVADLNLSIPCVIDNMENTTDSDYSGWPDRLFVVGQDGKIAMSGARGPFGFKPNELELALVDELKKVGKFQDDWELVAQDATGMGARRGRAGPGGKSQQMRQRMQQRGRPGAGSR